MGLLGRFKDNDLFISFASPKEGRALKICPVGKFSEGASLQRWQKRSSRTSKVPVKLNKNFCHNLK
jgi:hypothetical protein